MQRLHDTDIFLRPNGMASQICRLTEAGLVEGARVSIPADGRVSVSEPGFIAALNSKGTRVWSARIDEELKARSIRSDRLPKGVVGHSIAVLGHKLFVGGTSDRKTWLGMADLRADAEALPEGTGGTDGGELALEALPEGADGAGDGQLAFEALAMPTQLGLGGKPIDDLLAHGTRLLAVDDIVLPKWILVYDLTRGNRPTLVHQEQIPCHHTYEHILHGAVGGGWLTLLSTSVGRMGSFRHLGIYHAGTLREVAAFHFELDPEGNRSMSVQATGYVFAAPVHRQTRQQSADSALPAGFVPEQVVCVESRIYVLGASGGVVSLGLGRLGPERVVALDDLEGWFRQEPVARLKSGKATLLVAVPKRGQVVAMNAEGEAMVLGRSD